MRHAQHIGMTLVEEELRDASKNNAHAGVATSLIGGRQKALSRVRRRRSDAAAEALQTRPPASGVPSYARVRQLNHSGGRLGQHRRRRDRRNHRGMRP